MRKNLPSVALQFSIFQHIMIQSDLPDAKSFEKVPRPELSEIEENESDSISTNLVTFLMTLRRRTKT